jgi:hypothetical protein
MKISCVNARGVFRDHKVLMNAGQGRGLDENKFTAEENQKLLELVGRYGSSDWLAVAREMQTLSPRQCRQRWNDHVNANLQTCVWTTEEDDLLESKLAELGPHWKAIASFFPDRPKKSVKNHCMALNKRNAQVSAEINPAPSAAGADPTAVREPSQGGAESLFGDAPCDPFPPFW